jgi:hypothetical protein
MDAAEEPAVEARTHYEDRDTKEMFDFDPSRVEEFIQDVEMYFDSQRRGRYDETQRIAFLSRCTADPDLRDFVRRWRKEGLPTGDELGRTKPWHAATWEDAKTALRLMYPTSPEDDRAADKLDELTQQSRVPTHNAKYMQLHSQAGEVLAPNTTGRIAIKRYISTLSKELHPDMDDGVTQSINKELTTALNKGEIRELQQAMAQAVSLDKNLDALARAAGVPGAAYWSKARRGRRVNAVTTAADGRAPSAADERLMRVEDRVQGLELSAAKLRTDVQSSMETLSADLDKRLKVTEARAESTEDLCKKDL